MNAKDKINLALVCGGRSAERDVSLSGAEEVKKALDPAKYNVTVYDSARDISRLVADAPGIDVAFVLLHGKYGEDGTIQGLFRMLDIPFQGSGVLGSALAMDKHLSKVVYSQAGLATPAWRVLEKNDSGRPDFAALAGELGLPLMVKPCSQGSSVGMALVKETAGLEAAVEEAFRWDSRVMVEEYVTGRELTAGVLGNRELTSLPVVEIIPGSDHEFFDREAKYVPGITREICPARLPDDVTDAVQEAGIRAHRALGLRGYSRTDMIRSSDGTLYVLETNTIPGMTPTSLFPQAAAAAGICFSALLDRLIGLALEER